MEFYTSAQSYFKSYSLNYVCVYHVMCMWVHMHALELVYSSLLNTYSPSLSISCTLGALRFR